MSLNEVEKIKGVLRDIEEQIAISLTPSKKQEINMKEIFEIIPKSNAEDDEIYGAYCSVFLKNLFQNVSPDKILRRVYYNLQKWKDTVADEYTVDRDLKQLQTSVETLEDLIKHAPEIGIFNFIISGVSLAELHNIQRKNKAFEIAYKRDAKEFDIIVDYRSSFLNENLRTQRIKSLLYVRKKMNNLPSYITDDYKVNRRNHVMYCLLKPYDESSDGEFTELPLFEEIKRNFEGENFLIIGIPHFYGFTNLYPLDSALQKKRMEMSDRIQKLYTTVVQAKEELSSIETDFMLSKEEIRNLENQGTGKKQPPLKIN